MRTNWPSLDYAEWQDTCAALHLYMQIVGKYRLAHTPWVNHSWHATFYVTARGVTTSLIPDGPDIEIEFDLVNHLLIGTNGEGRTSSFSLGPMTVAAFHASVTTMIADLDGRPQFDRRPNEVPFPVPFDEDHLDRPYDVDAVRRYHQVLISVDRVFKRFRTSFLGKCSPVHLFWGSFDLAVTRFSGRRAPQHGGGIPALPDRVAQEAYDREVSSAGFWPGGGGFSQPAFYSYAYPAPEGFRNAEVQPAAATWDQGLSNSFCLMRPYGRPTMAMQRCWHFWKAPTVRPPRWEGGIASFLTATTARPEQSETPILDRRRLHPSHRVQTSPMARSPDGFLRRRSLT